MPTRHPPNRGPSVANRSPRYVYESVRYCHLRNAHGKLLALERVFNLVVLDSAPNSEGEFYWLHLGERDDRAGPELGARLSKSLFPALIESKI